MQKKNIGLNNYDFGMFSRTDQEIKECPPYTEEGGDCSCAYVV